MPIIHLLSLNRRKCQWWQKHSVDPGDLSFCMPDSDELWNAPLGSESEVLSKADLSTAGRDNGDVKNWISQASALVHDERVGFDWI